MIKLKPFYIKYKKTAILSMRTRTNGGLVYLLPEITVRLMHLIPLVFLWRMIASSEIDPGMTLSQMISYTYVNTLLSQLLCVKTMASGWNYEGQLLNLYLRPMSVFGQLMAYTIGEWMPMLLFFSLPMALLGPFLGISLIPADIWFFPSLLLCVSLGFAIDFIFACITIRLGGMAWLSYVIRMAVVSLLSGSVIPFRLLPKAVETALSFQPFGSLASAPLSLFIGTEAPFGVIGMQLAWNLLLWPLSILWFKKSKERLVSYGG